MKQDTSEIYMAGYDQGRFDTLFDLGVYLRGEMVEDMSTGEKHDVVDPGLISAFTGMGLPRGYSSNKRSG